MYSVLQIVSIIAICLVVVIFVAYGSDMLYEIRVKRATVKHEKKLKKLNQN